MIFVLDKAGKERFGLCAGYISICLFDAVP